MQLSCSAEYHTDEEYILKPDSQNPYLPSLFKSGKNPWLKPLTPLTFLLNGCHRSVRIHHHVATQWHILWTYTKFRCQTPCKIMVPFVRCPEAIKILQNRGVDFDEFGVVWVKNLPNPSHRIVF